MLRDITGPWRRARDCRRDSGSRASECRRVYGMEGEGNRGNWRDVWSGKGDVEEVAVMATARKVRGSGKVVQQYGQSRVSAARMVRSQALQ